MRKGERRRVPVGLDPDKHSMCTGLRIPLATIRAVGCRLLKQALKWYAHGLILAKRLGRDRRLLARSRPRGVYLQGDERRACCAGWLSIFAVCRLDVGFSRCQVRAVIELSRELVVRMAERALLPLAAPAHQAHPVHPAAKKPSSRRSRALGAFARNYSYNYNSRALNACYIFTY